MWNNPLFDWALFCYSDKVLSAKETTPYFVFHWKALMLDERIQWLVLFPGVAVCCLSYSCIFYSATIKENTTCLSGKIKSWFNCISCKQLYHLLCIAKSFSKPSGSLEPVLISAFRTVKLIGKFWIPLHRTRTRCRLAGPIYQTRRMECWVSKNDGFKKILILGRAGDRTGVGRQRSYHLRQQRRPS